ncbi:O-acetyl-ADP-ribose deacetylase [Flavobacterium cerinum]|uniref:O-acetyl-ADP-ribose deacetylase n=1 Tax=Flavobacterium cerinum TaxID=2502784 RepID=A0ABY5IWI8_9FLAO|nr:O-acetyl-ADP-ribose deacetylase [Flavobacterium cerinum]UUC47213.1 O-acetyl-ADP-ribose deacetylase [Flavobacterium cerinum]
MTRLELIQGDITKINVDAIVNAANSSLLGGGGVDGAIHRTGGKQILEECIAIRNKQGGCKTGEAVYTSGGLLPCKYVIHTVGPVWNNQQNDETLLANCYYNSLKLAVALNIKTIAFPNISTGIYRFPKATAATIAIETVTTFLKKEQHTLNSIHFVCFDQENFVLYEEGLKNLKS